MATTYGVHKEVLCVGNEQSLRFAKDVLSEIIELFPSHYIHVGGDECPRDRWQQCPKCQALIHNNGWKDTKEHKAEDKLQSYFMTEVENWVVTGGFAVSMISKSVRIHYRKLPPSISSVYRPVYGRSELIPRNGLST